MTAAVIVDYVPMMYPFQCFHCIWYYRFDHSRPFFHFSIIYSRFLFCVFFFWFPFLFVPLCFVGLLCGSFSVYKYFFFGAYSQFTLILLIQIFNNAKKITIGARKTLRVCNEKLSVLNEQNQGKKIGANVSRGVYASIINKIVSARLIWMQFLLFISESEKNDVNGKIAILQRYHIVFRWQLQLHSVLFADLMCRLLCSTLLSLHSFVFVIVLLCLAAAAAVSVLALEMKLFFFFLNNYTKCRDEIFNQKKRIHSRCFVLFVV